MRISPEPAPHLKAITSHPSSDKSACPGPLEPPPEPFEPQLKPWRPTKENSDGSGLEPAIKQPREQAMTITSPMLIGAAHATALPSDSVSTFFRAFGAGSPDCGLGVIRAALAGVAAALAGAIALSVYFRSG